MNLRSGLNVFSCLRDTSASSGQTKGWGTRKFSTKVVVGRRDISKCPKDVLKGVGASESVIMVTYAHFKKEE